MTKIRNYDNHEKIEEGKVALGLYGKKENRKIRLFLGRMKTERGSKRKVS